MTENGRYPLPEDSDWVRTEFPEEARRMERERRPLILGGFLGTEMMMLYQPMNFWEEEEDPNP